MVRYTLFIIAVLGTAATAVSAYKPAAAPILMGKNVTVIEMNQLWPMEGDLVVHPCAKEDCSDTPQG